MLGRGGRRSGATSTDDDKADDCIAGNCYKDERGLTLVQQVFNNLLYHALQIFICKAESAGVAELRQANDNAADGNLNK